MQALKHKYKRTTLTHACILSATQYNRPAATHQKLSVAKEEAEKKTELNKWKEELNKIVAKGGGKGGCCNGSLVGALTVSRGG